MRCKHCEGTDAWQVAYDEHDITFARRINLRGARLAPTRRRGDEGLKP